MYVGFTTTGVGLDKNRSFGAVVRQERNTWRVRDSAPPLRRWSSRRVCVILGTVRESALERLIAAIALIRPSSSDSRTVWSEEHTSGLQSRVGIVSLPLLEKTTT